MFTRSSTAGGQYHWISEFSPRWCQNYLSCITGRAHSICYHLFTWQHGTGAFGLSYSYYAVLHHHRSCRSPQWQDCIPFIQLFYNVTRSYVDGNVMIATVITALVFAVVSEIATASRQIWSFARDNGLPFSSLLRNVGSCQHVAFQLQLNRSHRFKMQCGSHSAPMSPSHLSISAPPLPWTP